MDLDAQPDCRRFLAEPAPVLWLGCDPGDRRLGGKRPD